MSKQCVFVPASEDAGQRWSGACSVPTTPQVVGIARGAAQAIQESRGTGDQSSPGWLARTFLGAGNSESRGHSVSAETRRP